MTLTIVGLCTVALTLSLTHLQAKRVPRVPRLWCHLLFASHNFMGFTVISYVSSLFDCICLGDRILGMVMGWAEKSTANHIPPDELS